jgi:guanosine-3',5'-bis(diphosphate) 3'-pyrophosphohydrolase
VSGIEQAVRIALEVHGGQKDKGGEPYILHVLRVMNAVPPGELQVVAVLHDVVEDSAGNEEEYRWDLDRLKRFGFSNNVLAALESLTHLRYEPYGDYIARVARNRLARVVKIADLRDNMDMSRIPDPKPRDHDRREKYSRAFTQLSDMHDWPAAAHPAEEARPDAE